MEVSSGDSSLSGTQAILHQLLLQAASFPQSYLPVGWHSVLGLQMPWPGPSFSSQHQIYHAHKRQSHITSYISQNNFSPTPSCQVDLVSLLHSQSFMFSVSPIRCAASAMRWLPLIVDHDDPWWTSTDRIIWAIFLYEELHNLSNSCVHVKPASLIRRNCNPKCLVLAQIHL